MNRKLILAATMPLLSLAGVAAVISPEQALSRLNSDAPLKAPALAALSHVATLFLEENRPAAYVFTPRDGQGFTILAADDVAAPVLGYSDSGTIDPDNIPPALNYWIGVCAENAAIAAQNGASAQKTHYVPANVEAIAPLLSTTWDQMAPYNNNCPVVSGVVTPTGCCATSVAQVMNYFKYPEKGTGRISYRDSSGVTRQMSFSGKFNWDNMLDSYAGSYTEEQADAVAHLMKAAGYAQEMHYQTSASGAMSYKAQQAMIEYFKYDEGTWYTERTFYDYDTWFEMLYSNIRNIGPIVCDGVSIDGGHSFVLDGYDGNGYFHFNWGWGGISDGYFLLDSLNPTEQGTGGSSGGYNYSQGVLLGLQPATENPDVQPLKMRIYGTVKALKNGQNIEFYCDNAQYQGWADGCYKDISVRLGALVTDLEGNLVQTLSGELRSTSGGASSSVITLSAQQYYPSSSYHLFTDLPSNLSNGTYKVTLVCQDSNDDTAPWVPFLAPWGAANYCMLNVSDSGIEVSSVDYAQVTFKDCYFDSPLYTGRNAKLKTIVANETDVPLTLCFYPQLWRDGEAQYQSDYLLLNLEPGEEADLTFLANFMTLSSATSTGSGDYQLRLYDIYSGLLLYASDEDYYMTSITTSLSLTLDDLSVEDCPIENVTVGGKSYSAYIVDNDRFNIHYSVQVKTGYWDSFARVVMVHYDETAGSFVDTEDILYEIPYVGAGDVFERQIEMDLLEYPSSLYRVRASYTNIGSTKTLGTMYFSFTNTGIDGVVDSDAQNSKPVYYNLQGVRVDNPVPGQLLIEKNDGNTKKIIF